LEDKETDEIASSSRSRSTCNCKALGVEKLFANKNGGDRKHHKNYLGEKIGHEKHALRIVAKTYFMGIRRFWYPHVDT
jgi:hypothetical protein